MSLAHEEYVQERKTLGELRQVGGLSDKLEAHDAGLEKHIDKVLLAADEIGVGRTTVTAQLNERDVLKHVIDRFGRNDDKLKELIAGHLIEWRTGSGTAHGPR